MSVVQRTPNRLRCDVPGCTAEIAVRVGQKQRCFQHAIERASEIRRAQGLPPIALDEEGTPHVCQ
jgi:hypothetical protein